MIVETIGTSIYLTGEFKVKYRSFKTVEVDGEIYSKEVNKEVVFDLKKTENVVYSFFFEELGLTYELKCEEKYFTKNFFDMIPKKTLFSTNESINTIYYLFENGYLDSRILNISNSKYEPIQNYLLNYGNFIEFVRSKQVDFVAFKYGGNNLLKYSVSWQTLFEMPLEKIQKITNKIHFLKSTNAMEKALKLLNLKIRYYETS